MTEPTNEQRARYAREALIPFTARTGGGDHPDTMDVGDLETAIHDLITDVMHLANLRGLDALDIHFRACRRYEEEVDDIAEAA